MPSSSRSQQGKESLSDIQKEARASGVREGYDSNSEIVRKMIEEEERKEMDRETGQLERALHKSSIATASQGTDDSGGAVAVQPNAQKSEYLLEVEHVLADGLGDVYNSMEPSLKIRFKVKGEEIAYQIEQVMAQGKAKARLILAWIITWLKMIPGVNNFFLEQEAKIKTDKIIGMGLGKY